MTKMSDYNKARKELFATVGYEEDFKNLPVIDCTSHYWKVVEEGRFMVTVAYSECPDYVGAVLPYGSYNRGILYRGTGAMLLTGEAYFFDPNKEIK